MASKAEIDIHYNKCCLRVITQVDKPHKTQDFRKIRNNTQISKLDEVRA